MPVRAGDSARIRRHVIPYGFKVDPWTITNPVVAIDGAIAAPFAARALVAWTVRGRIGRGNVSPRRQRSDYPVPNDFWLEYARLLIVVAGALPVAWLGSALLSGLPTETWPALFVISGGGSLAWAWRRIRSDDRLTGTLLAQRLSDQVDGQS
jgi:hypothetical protein